MTMTPEKELLAYMDGELDLENTLRVEQRIADSKSDANLLADFKFARRAVRDYSTRYQAPSATRSLLYQTLEVKSGRASRPKTAVMPWWSAATSIACSALVASLLTWHFTQTSPEQAIAEQIVNGHVRAKLSTHQVDILASDSHTVKPWFGNKLDFSPVVKDLATEGFPLAGGRVEYIGKQRVAALVYHRRKHLIDVFVLPSSQLKSPLVFADKSKGFNTEIWVEDGLSYIAISDVNQADLAKLKSLLQ
jgi:anti-sigma factor RsiW